MDQETTLKILLIIIIVIVSLTLITIGVFLALRFYYSRKKINALLAKSNRNENFVPRLISAKFYGAKLIRDAELPEPVGGGSFVNVKSDLIYVSQGGIAVMSLCGIPGAIDNSGVGNWKISGRDGETEIVNPLEANKHAINAILQILKEESVYNVPIYNFAVFYGKKAVFRIKSNKLLTARTVLSTLSDMNHDSFLSKQDVEDAYNAINKYRSKAPRVNPAPQLKKRKRTK